MIAINQFIREFSTEFPGEQRQPWEITAGLQELLLAQIAVLGQDYTIENGVAIHQTAVIEKTVVLKGPLIIGMDCFVGAHACLRGGVYLGRSVKIGTGCEIKSSLLFSNTAIAHFNFIGDSVIGSDVNFEAGSITANHYNERANKHITVLYQSRLIETQAVKFGSLVGDAAKIGANAVLSPGTVLLPGSVVKRLELVEQVR